MIILVWILSPVLGAGLLMELAAWPAVPALAAAFFSAEALRMVLRFTLSPDNGAHYALDALKETPVRALETAALGLCLAALAGLIGWSHGAGAASMAEGAYEALPAIALPERLDGQGPALISTIAALLILAVRILRRRRQPIRGARAV
ncbi:hypothetical protein F1654_10330 [Alkalicaulis satelles]|uniref:Uncharacterized protein n=1 Tax=Alkalicaulis satelles TaxID=2609175 RepID=A0A5M6ZBX8_9PROT|nr:hypothetical protein [Alkalicaulis satelles]KAA5802226.1 hypothetical protein F1654_10330 [Alkalicaulis satelles]